MRSKNFIAFDMCLLKTTCLERLPFEGNHCWPLYTVFTECDGMALAISALHINATMWILFAQLYSEV